MTGYAPGTRAGGGERVLHALGDLLGRLHSLPPGSGPVAREGGAWHHLSHEGGPRAEIDAASWLLAAAGQRVPAEQRTLCETLRGELEAADDCRGLPHALIHPDFVPANVIASPGGGLGVVDWTGAGRGPRLSCLAFLLWAAGGRDLARVDAVVAGYQPHIRLEPAELARLAGAIRARPLIFDCWAFRLSWPARVRCFELDTTDVLDRKARLLTAETVTAGCERIPVACDLRADWPAALLAAGFEPGQPTIWLAEGLLAYLTPEDVDAALAALTRLSAAERTRRTSRRAGPASAR